MRSRLLIDSPASAEIALLDAVGTIPIAKASSSEARIIAGNSTFLSRDIGQDSFVIDKS